MRRALAVAIAVGLLAGIMAMPAEAQKKKRKKPVPVDVTYYFRNDAGECGADNYRLKLEEASEGANCGSPLSGPGNEVLVNAGQDPAIITYVADEGLPFTLNATKELTGTIAVSSYNGAGVGPTTLVVAIAGRSGDETVEMGTAEVDYVVTPATIHEVEFAIELDGSLNRKSFTSLAVAVYNRGFAPLHGFYRTFGPASYVTVPTIVRR